MNDPATQNALAELAAIAFDGALPRRRRFHLVQEFLRGNAPGTAAGQPAEPKPTHQPTTTTGRDDPAQAGERPTTTIPASRPEVGTATKIGAHPKTTAQRRPRKATKAPGMTPAEKTSWTQAVKRSDPELYRAYRAAANAAARAAYDPEQERARKARREALHPGREAARKREWARTHRESRNRTARAWMAAHPEKAAEYRERYWAKRKALGLPDRHEESARRWAALVADEEAHAAFNAERAAYRRTKREHQRDYRPQPSRVHHAFERYCPAFAPGAQGLSGVGYARELWRERNPK